MKTEHCGNLAKEPVFVHIINFWEEIRGYCRLEYIMLLNLLFFPAVIFSFKYYSHFNSHLFSSIGQNSSCIQSQTTQYPLNYNVLWTIAMLYNVFKIIVS